MGLERDTLSPRPCWVEVATADGRLLAPRVAPGAHVLPYADWVPGLRIMLAGHQELHFPTTFCVVGVVEIGHLHGACSQRQLLGDS